MEEHAVSWNRTTGWYEMHEVASQIAIVIPCHSYPTLLPETLASIREQIVSPATVLCILDHVSMSDYREIDNYAGEYGTDQYLVWPVVNNHSPGVSGARNMGFEEISYSNSQWVVPLDEDDLLETKEKGFIYRICQSIEANPWVDIHYTDWIEFGTTLEHHSTPDYSYETLLQAPFITCTAAIRTSTWQAVKEANGQGYDEHLHELGLRWEDYLFYLEAGALGAKMARVGLPLVKARRHGSSGTTVANETIPQWRAYATEKLKRLYGVDTPWNSQT